MANISAYHGEVKPCDCGLYEHPERMGEKSCRQCFGRGFTASCTGCEGTGQILEKMAGGPGTMSATCSFCGGNGKFGVNKPANWDETHPAAVPETSAELVAA